MTAYFSSFDLAEIGAGTVTLSASGVSDISVNLATFTWDSVYSATSRVSKFNHIISGTTPGVAQYLDFGYATLAATSFLGALTQEFKDLAAAAGWPSSNTIGIGLSHSTLRVSFAYRSELTAIEFSNTEARRLFGFAGDFSGSSAVVTGTELPKYVIVPTVDGAASASVVYEDDVVSSSAYGGSGGIFGMSRSTTLAKRDWVQPYESLKRTFRQYADPAPDEFTFEGLFEHSRSGMPFAVLDFGDELTPAYHAYVLRPDQDEFRPRPATPGNADQFHLQFRALMLGRIRLGNGLVINGIQVTNNDDEMFVNGN